MAPVIEMKQDFSTPLPSEAWFSNDVEFHSSFYEVEKKIHRWLTRFRYPIDQFVVQDLFLFYLLASKKFLDHRYPSHLFNLFLSIHLMQKTLAQKVAFSPQDPHIKIRWLPGTLKLPFSKRSVLGCLVGHNALDKYELFDEENLCLAFQKQLPEIRLVKESLYQHTGQNKNLKLHYFEIEKKDGSNFSLHEQNLLKNNAEERVRNSVQKLSPSTFMKQNEEEAYKSILVLSNEISSLEDLPQATINLDEHTGKEIVFQVVLVHPAPFHSFFLEERFVECTFVSNKVTIAKHLDDHPIQAHVFTLRLSRNAAFLRTDGSLDFNLARQKVVSLLQSAIGPFRDYNGGLLLKQQEHLEKFRDTFPEVDYDILEKFFYSIAPLEKRATLDLEILSSLFKFFLVHQREKLHKRNDFILADSQMGEHLFLFVKGNDCSLGDTISSFMNENFFQSHVIAYSLLNTLEGIFFTAVSLNPAAGGSLTRSLKQKLMEWQKRIEGKKVLKIGVEYMPVSLDPRIGGDNVSADTISLLFEGLMRYDEKEQLINGVAQSIETSADAKQYIFKLRQSFWNDGTSVTAHDFEYSWKKILSPDFKTPIAEFFSPLKNALKAKQGKVPLENVGIQSLDDHTLKVELEHPTPFFLQLTAHSFYSPIHRIIDQKRPQWPYECESNYPCNGPFQLKINQPNQGFQLTRNPFYWASNYANWDQINLIHMAHSQALHAFQNDEVDWIGNPFGTFHSEFVTKKKGEGEVFTFPNTWVCWQVFNTTCAPFNSRRIREAFCYAIDRESIVSNAYFPLNPAFSTILHRNSNPNRETLFPPFDPSRARQLFHEALSELNLSIEDLDTITLVYTEGGIRESTAHCLKQQFKEALGVKCELKPLPWNKLFNQLTSGNFQIGLMNTSPLIDDPLHKLNYFRMGASNVAKWEHPDYQNFLHLSEQQINPFQRSSYLIKAERLLRDEMPVIPIFYQPSLGLVKKNLQIVQNLSGSFNIARSFRKDESHN